MIQSGHHSRAEPCPLSGVMRTSVELKRAGGNEKFARSERAPSGTVGELKPAGIGCADHSGY
jgi:hypothetical protein